jgi:hypothetical protein
MRWNASKNRMRPVGTVERLFPFIWNGWTSPRWANLRAHRLAVHREGNCFSARCCWMVRVCSWFACQTLIASSRVSIEQPLAPPLEGCDAGPRRIVFGIGLGFRFRWQATTMMLGWMGG